MRRLLTILLWTLKTVLLLVALAALFLWPVSRGRAMAVSVYRYSAGPASGEYRAYTAAFWDGRAFIGRGWQYAWGDLGLDRIRKNVEAGGDGWRWERRSEASTWNERDWPSRWGPLRWRSYDFNDPGRTNRFRYVAAPLWLVALAAGAWPLGSIVFVLRRRRRLRRAGREGLCKHCGYDLRATPQPDGALLPVCPECGMENPTPSRQGAKTQAEAH